MSRSYELFLRFPEFKTRAVTFSYDDGDLSDRDMIAILNRYGMKATFNLNAGRIVDHPQRVQFEDFEEVYRGHEIASHTFTHPHLNNLDLGGIAYQIVKDRELLEEAVQKPVQGFAYPYGLKQEFPDMVNCLKCCGLRYARTIRNSHRFVLPEDFLRWDPTCHHEDPEFDQLADKFFKPDDLEHPWRIKLKLFFIWGHSREFNGNWELLDRICRRLANKENVWYATNGEIVDYVSAFYALRRSVNGKFIHNPTDVDLYVCVNKKDIILEKGKITTLE